MLTPADHPQQNFTPDSFQKVFHFAATDPRKW
ncbi:hypothetical protein CYB_2681 [Synechococcus sp. JA-2-3B'a(2-13)]|nr:hypothetical protein CYB_2681 [Synechococcus sp. JA-2-3B'a(2-13)]